MRHRISTSQPQWSANRLICLFLLAYVSAYIILGNIPRFLSLVDTGNTIPATELGLYFILFLAFPLKYRMHLIIIRRYLIFGFFFTASFIYGIVLNDFNAKALLFNARLQLQIIISIGVGCLIYLVYGNNTMRVMKYYIKIYIAATALALIIFISFPDSSAFYSYLGSIGVNYIGDPHQYRLISSYLDPNLFAGIIILPILISLFIYWRTSDFRYLLTSFLFLISLILTASRSGLGTFAIILISILAAISIRFILGMASIDRRRFLQIFLFSSIFIGFMIFSAVILGDKIIERFSTPISEEGSALLRYESFLIGLDLMLESPLLGVGYNYGVLAAEERTLVSLHEGVQVGFDSSLQTALVNFGAIPTIILLCWLIYWYRKTCAQLVTLSIRSNDAIYFLKILFYYIVTIILFTSQFNNIVFYQFWLVPVVALASYLGCCAGLLRSLTWRS